MLAALQPADEFDASGILLSQCRSELAEVSTIFPRLRSRSTGALLAGCASGWRCARMERRACWFLWDRSGNSGCSWLQNGTAAIVNSVRERHGQAALTMSSSRIWLSVGSTFRLPRTPARRRASAAQRRAAADLNGNVQDSDMRRVLAYVVENGERFDAGVRLDCLEALKTASRDQQVRRA